VTTSRASPVDHRGVLPAANLPRATLGMAIGTAISRLTGVGRLLALAYALGFLRLTDAYNLANTTPNMLYDVVLGGVLSATFIPVFVDRLATRSPREAWRAISAIVTLALGVLVVASCLAWVLSPWIIDAYTVFRHAPQGGAHHALDQERAVATTLLRWFVPQIFFYGLISLMTALLNTRSRFGAPMWVPIANNLVSIGVLLAFHALVPKPSLAGAELHPHQLVLLGLGTTLGVVAQALLLLPSLVRAGLPRLRLRWEPRHEAVQTVLRLGAWTFGFVIANQVALYVVLALAVTAKGPAPVSSYTYAYTFMQMPYAVVAVSIMSAVTPDLSRSWAIGDLIGFHHRLVRGLRAVLAVILPAAVGMVLLAKPAVALLLGHGVTTTSDTTDTGACLAILGVGLPGFCTFLYVVRVLQSMQRPEAAFWLYLIENGINVIAAFGLVGILGVRGLAASISIAYSVAAVAGIFVLRHWLGRLGSSESWYPLRRVLGATATMGVTVLVVSNLLGATHGIALLLRVLSSMAAGILVFFGAASAFALRHERERSLQGRHRHSSP